MAYLKARKDGSGVGMSEPGADTDPNRVLLKLYGGNEDDRISAIILVLIGEINTLRAGLIPPLPPLTPEEFINAVDTKLKG